MLSSDSPANAVDGAAHVVQLYGGDKRLLTRNVGRYLGEGLQQGHGLLVIATAEHSYAFAQQLRSDGAYQSAVREGRLVFLDAQIMLSRFMVEGQPDWTSFERVAGEVLREVRTRSASASVRAYGEMVGLLWQAGQWAAAVRLEEYWNRLLAAYNFDLFCAYPIDVLADDAQPEALDALLCTHTHLVSAHGDLEQIIDARQHRQALQAQARLQ